jgi:MATE family multidrug resistance protein
METVLDQHGQNIEKHSEKMPDGLDQTSLRYMLKLAAPTVITTTSFTIMQFIDRVMVSRLGTDAFAAILPAGVVSFLPTSFAAGTMTSLNTFVSQSLGRGKTEDCSKYLWQMIYVGFLYFILVLAVMWPTASWIFKAMGQPNAIIGMEVTYFRIMLYAHIVAIINYASTQFFIGIHRPVITLYASLCGQLVNVAANYLLIFGKFGFPRMEIAGAGWGTFIGIAVAAGINMLVFLTGRMNKTFSSRRISKIEFGKIYDLLKVGLPAGFSLTANVSFWGIMLLALVGRFGKEALAATSAALSYTSVAVMPIVGIGMALTAAVGKTIGEGRKKLATKQTRVCLRIALTYIGFVGICFLLFPKALMAFWSSDNKVIQLGVPILICAAIYQTFHATRIIYDSSLRGAGDTVWPAVVSALGATVVLGLGGLFIVNFIPSLGALGPWIAATFSMISVGLANRWRFKSKKWMQIDLFKQPAPPVPVTAPPVGQ